MFNSKKIYGFILFFGDIAVFYASLYLALLIRYKNFFNKNIWDTHIIPFLLVHTVWILIFYINGFYDLKSFASKRAVFEKVVKSMAIAGIFAILIFYLVPDFKITPKTNLLLDILFVSALLILWRRIFFLFAASSSKTKILFYGMPKELPDIVNYLKKHTHLGIFPAAIVVWKNENKTAFKDNIKIYDFDSPFKEIIKNENINIIVAFEKFIKSGTASKKLYDILPTGITVVDFSEFYEAVMEKIPVYAINENWFFKNIEANKKANEILKRFFDLMFTIIIGILTLPIIIFASILTKITRGEIFYFQKRVGKNGKIFNVIKFGSMVLNAERNGAEWAKRDDPRITKFGKFLRKTRIDELPQLLNVFKGDMSFVGPRPERPEFVEELEKIIPHYSMRHLVKPGLSGWAQIKFTYGSSVLDAMQKLQYDLYYIKNRSIILDIAISLKTLAIIAKREGI